jgi:molybdate transport system regulatory protein
MTRTLPPAFDVRPRIRIVCGDDIALGPGKADLLAAIAAEGTIAGAAKQLGMSYMRAWSLVRTMNRCFREPLVETARGGSVHGGAALTAVGQDVLALYRRMEAASLTGLEPTWLRLRPYLKAPRKPRQGSGVKKP